MANCDKIERKLLRQMDTLETLYRRSKILHSQIDEDAYESVDYIIEDLNELNDMVGAMTYGLPKIREKIKKLKRNGRFTGPHRTHPMYEFINNGGIDEHIYRMYEYIIAIWKDIYHEKIASIPNIDDIPKEDKDNRDLTKCRLKPEEYLDAIKRLLNNGTWKYVTCAKDFNYRKTDAIIIDDVIYIRHDSFHTLDYHYNCNMNDIIQYLIDSKNFKISDNGSLLYKISQVQAKINRDIRKENQDKDLPEVNKIINKYSLKYYGIYLKDLELKVEE